MFTVASCYLYNKDNNLRANHNKPVFDRIGMQVVTYITKIII